MVCINTLWYAKVKYTMPVDGFLDFFHCPLHRRTVRTEIELYRDKSIVKSKMLEKKKKIFFKNFLLRFKILSRDIIYLYIEYIE